MIYPKTDIELFEQMESVEECVSLLLRRWQYRYASYNENVLLSILNKDKLINHIFSKLPQMEQVRKVYRTYCQEIKHDKEMQAIFERGSHQDYLAKSIGRFNQHLAKPNWLYHFERNMTDLYRLKELISYVVGEHKQLDRLIVQENSESNISVNYLIKNFKDKINSIDGMVLFVDKNDRQNKKMDLVEAIQIKKNIPPNTKNINFVNAVTNGLYNANWVNCLQNKCLEEMDERYLKSAGLAVFLGCKLKNADISPEDKRRLLCTTLATGVVDDTGKIRGVHPDDLQNKIKLAEDMGASVLFYCLENDKIEPTISEDSNLRLVKILSGTTLDKTWKRMKKEIDHSQFYESEILSDDDFYYPSSQGFLRGDWLSVPSDIAEATGETVDSFRLKSRLLGGDEIITFINKWIHLKRSHAKLIWDSIAGWKWFDDVSKECVPTSITHPYLAIAFVNLLSYLECSDSDGKLDEYLVYRSSHITNFQKDINKRGYRLPTINEIKAIPREMKARIKWEEFQYILVENKINSNKSKPFKLIAKEGWTISDSYGYDDLPPAISILVIGGGQYDE